MQWLQLLNLPGTFDNTVGLHGQEELFSGGLAARLVSGLAQQRLDFYFRFQNTSGQET